MVIVLGVVRIIGGHNLNCEIGLKLAKVWGPLVHYGVEIVLGIVVISHKTVTSTRQTYAF